MCVVLIQPRGRARTYQSYIGHTLSYNTNSQVRVHQTLILE